MQYFIGTGILLRTFDRLDPVCLSTRTALRTLIARGDTLFSAAQNVAEFWNGWTRPSTSRGGYGQSIPSATRHVQFITRFGKILTESQPSFAEWQRLVATHGVQGAAVHDARLGAIIEASGITHILTLYPDDFRRYPGLVILTPDDVR